MSGADTAKKKWLDKIEQTLVDFVTLDIVTQVGDDSITTRIELATGDITTTMSANFLEPRYQKLWDYHQAQVAEGRTIVRDNLDLAGKVIASVGKAFDEVGKGRGEAAGDG